MANGALKFHSGWHSNTTRPANESNTLQSPQSAKPDTEGEI